MWTLVSWLKFSNEISKMSGKMFLLMDGFWILCFCNVGGVMYRSPYIWPPLILALKDQLPLKWYVCTSRLRHNFPLGIYYVHLLWIIMNCAWTKVHSNVYFTCTNISQSTLLYFYVGHNHDWEGDAHISIKGRIVCTSRKVWKPTINIGQIHSLFVLLLIFRLICNDCYIIVLKVWTK